MHKLFFLLCILYANVGWGMLRPLAKVSFNQAEQTAHEGERISVDLSLDHTSDNFIYVPYEVTGSASFGTDHNLKSGILLFFPGQETNTLSVDLFVDQVIEPAKNITIKISSPIVNATHGALSTHTVTIPSELPTNHAPVMIGDQSFQGNEDTKLTFTLNGATDSDGDTLTYNVVSSPTQGTLENCLQNSSGLTCDYFPPANFTGVVNFSYRAFDGKEYSALSSSVSLTINAVIVNPIADFSINLNNGGIIPFQANFDASLSYVPGHENEPDRGISNCNWLLSGAGSGNKQIKNVSGCQYNPTINVKGNYSLTLTVTGSNGAFSSITKTFQALENVSSTEMTAISSHGEMSCSLAADKTVYCWGSTQTSVPKLVSGLSNIEEIAVGNFHACALNNLGEVYCWGKNSLGETGTLPSSGTVLTPTKIASLSSVKSIAAGHFHTCAILADDTVKCWGSNLYGELGIGSYNSTHLPTTVVGLAHVTQISLGFGFTCAVYDTGFVKCWGYGESGNLGQGTFLTSNVPVNTLDLTNVIKVDSGYDHSCAILQDESVWCWGNNQYGQLGKGTLKKNNSSNRTTKFRKNNRGSGIFQNINRPARATVMPQAKDIFVGYFHTCATKPDDTVWCWGYNQYKQLGNGSTINSLQAVQAIGIANVAQINNGANESYALLADGKIYAWGLNSQGRLGTGNTGANLDPTLVSFNISSQAAANFNFMFPGGTQVNFDASSSIDTAGAIIKYDWKFGDGAIGVGRNISHIYSQFGNYNVTLTITDDHGNSNSISKVVAVVDQNLPPLANFSFIQITENQPYGLDFDASSSFDPDGSIVNYKFTFGDGDISNVETSPFFHHDYSFRTTLLVTLTVTDNKGKEGSVSKMVTIIGENLPPLANFSWTTPIQIREEFEVDGMQSLDPDGQIVLFKWSLDGEEVLKTGDVRSTMVSSISGPRILTLTVVDNEGKEGTISHLIIVGPVTPSNPNVTFSYGELTDWFTIGTVETMGRCHLFEPTQYKTSAIHDRRLPSYVWKRTFNSKCDDNLYAALITSSGTEQKQGLLTQYSSSDGAYNKIKGKMILLTNEDVFSSSNYNDRFKILLRSSGNDDRTITTIFDQGINSVTWTTSGAIGFRSATEPIPFEIPLNLQSMDFVVEDGGDNLVDSGMAIYDLELVNE